MNDLRTNAVEISTKQSANSTTPVPKSESGRQTNNSEHNARTEAPTQTQVKEAVTHLNDYVQTVQRNLHFQLDSESGKTIITVVDRSTSEVVRQIPDDVALRLARDLQQEEPLSLFNAKV